MEILGTEIVLRLKQGTSIKKVRQVVAGCWLQSWGSRERKGCSEHGRAPSF